MRVVVAHSEDVDTASAVGELLRQCDAKLADAGAPGAALLYAPPTADHELLLAKLGERFPGLALIGCSSDASASSALAFREESISLTLFCSKTVGFSAAVARDVSKDPEGAIERAVREAAKGLNEEPALCIILPDSLTTSGARLVLGARRALGSDAVPVVGGFATDHGQHKITYQYFGSEVLSDATPVLLFGGNLLSSHGVAAGWNPVGRQSRVTKVDGSRVLEIEGKPALEFYRYYLGKHALPSPEHPLAVFEDEGGSHYLRAPLGHDADSGSVSFTGEIPLGALVQLTETTRSDILEACERSVEQALESYPGETPQAALFFSCVARKMLLGTHTAREFEILKHLAGDLEISGMYAYGEIAPLRRSGRSYFHNETFVSLILGTA